MPVVPFLPVIAAGVGAAATVAGSRAQARAQQQAANVAQQSADASTAEQRRQFDLARSDQAPWLNTGRNALNVLAGLYNLNGTQGGANPAMTMPQTASGSAAQGGGYAGQLMGIGGQPDQAYQGQRIAMTGAEVRPMGGDGVMVTGGMPGAVQTGMAQVNQQGQGGNFAPFYASPDYQFNLQEGQRALTARNAALGIQDSGAAQKAALRFGAGLASQQYDTYANRLAALAGVGQTAAAQNAQLGQNYAGAITNINQNRAQQLGSSYANQGAINANMYGSLGGIASGLIQNYPWGQPR